MADATELAADPSFLPDGYDAAADLLRFAKIDRAGLVREAFLDRRMTASVTARAQAPAEAVEAALAKGALRMPAFVFHTAFCCSTLLARALDAPGHALALKEPRVLLDLANAARAPDTPRDPVRLARAARTIFALLARAHDGDERVVVKPTNTAATLAPFALKEGAQCLFLYGGLEDFLLSLLKKDEEARSFIRQQFNVYALGRTGLAAIAPRQATAMTDLQIAAVVWRHQMEQFATYIEGAPAGSVATLDFKALLARPAKALAAASDHLGLGVPDALLARAASGPIFATNSKFAGRAFDAQDRAREDAAHAERWRAEIDLIAGWAKTITLSRDLKLPLPQALDRR